jgi:hypothetical protein
MGVIRYIEADRALTTFVTGENACWKQGWVGSQNLSAAKRRNSRTNPGHSVCAGCVLRIIPFFLCCPMMCERTYLALSVHVIKFVFKFPFLGCIKCVRKAAQILVLVLQACSFVL